MNQAGIEALFDFGASSYPTLREMLADDSEFFWFCGHSSTHLMSSPLLYEPDPLSPDLVFEFTTPPDLSADEREGPITVAQVAAYLVVAIEVGDLYFAEYCAVQSKSDLRVVLNDLRALLPSEGGMLDPCDLQTLLIRHGVWFYGCELRGEDRIEASSLALRCGHAETRDEE
jgi:hypothetical protein